MNGTTQLVVNGFLYAIGVGIIGVYVRNVKSEVKDYFKEILGYRVEICEGKFKDIKELCSKNEHR